MELKLKISYLTIIVLFICFTVFYKYYLVKLPSYLNEDICSFAKIEVKGIIIDRVKDSKYNYVEISGLKKSVLISIEKIIYIKGFPEHYYYEKGDSIIKKANSKEFTIKNGNKIAIYLLKCDD